MKITKITDTNAGLIAWVCLAHVASMLCYAIYPTLLPQLQREWGAGNSAAGLISGIRCSAGRGRGQRQSGRLDAGLFQPGRTGRARARVAAAAMSAAVRMRPRDRRIRAARFIMMPAMNQQSAHEYAIKEDVSNGKNLA